MTHHHHEQKDTQSSLTFDAKMIKLLAHWVKHNEDHAGTYRDWAQRAEDNGMHEIAKLLHEVAEMTIMINARFAEASSHIKKGA